MKSKAEDLVVMDKTLPPRAAGVVDSPTTDPDLGHIFINYAYGAAPGQKGGLESATFMFLADVAMGKSFTPTSYNRFSQYPVHGYDSTFAKANTSNIHNNEMIVYDTAQCNLTH